MRLFILVGFTIGGLYAQQDGGGVNLRGRNEDQRQLIGLDYVGSNPVPHYPLGRCQGDCDNDGQCSGSLVCFQRDSNDPVPGCSGNDSSRTDYCIDPNDANPNSPTPPAPTPPAPTPSSPTSGNPSLTFVGQNPGGRLGECQGDCDSDNDCGSGLVCFQRSGGESVPGCSGSDSSRTDYCVRGGSNPSPTPPAPSPTSNNPPTSVSQSDFRLKLYWEIGYYWQEERIERKWCMKCRGGSCSNGEKLYIDWCESSSQRFDFVRVNNNESLIRIHDKNICMERQDRDIYLRTCSSGNSKQRWFAKNGGFDERRFEISQQGVSNLCITQRHHPKPDEEVELEPCEQARRGETSFWNRY